MRKVKVLTNGGVTGFLPMTPGAKDWFDINIDSAPWQWIGEVLWIDAHLVPSLVTNMLDAGFLFEH